MNYLPYILPPVIGGIIGYFTNLIAVKMLFFPRRQWRIFGRRVPFTPGVIPRRKSEFAKSIGRMVERELLTKDSLCRMLLSDKSKNLAAMSITNALTAGERPIRELVPDLATSDTRFRLESAVAEAICDTVCGLDMKTPIAIEGRELIREKFGALGAMLVNDSVMAGIAESAEEKIRDYIRGNKMLITAGIHMKSESLFAMNSEQIADAMGISPEEVYPMVATLYEKVVVKHLPEVLAHISIADTVAERVDAMDAKKLEDLILMVMKRELSAVVNLGALIGFILGLFNLLI